MRRRNIRRKGGTEGEREVKKRKEYGGKEDGVKLHVGVRGKLIKE